MVTPTPTPGPPLESELPPPLAAGLGCGVRVVALHCASSEESLQSWMPLQWYRTLMQSPDTHCQNPGLQSGGGVFASVGLAVGWLVGPSVGFAATVVLISISISVELMPGKG